jgi:hypothetical protein
VNASGGSARRLFLSGVTESKWAAQVRDSALGRNVVLYCNHGGVSGWYGLKSTDLSSLTYSSGDPTRMFVGYACKSGRYWDSPYFGRSLMGRDGTRALVASTEITAVSVDCDRTWEFWTGYGEGSQSPGNAKFFLDYLHTVTAPAYLYDQYEKLALFEYNLYGDPW